MGVLQESAPCAMYPGCPETLWRGSFRGRTRQSCASISNFVENERFPVCFPVRSDRDLHEGCCPDGRLTPSVAPSHLCSKAARDGVSPWYSVHRFPGIPEAVLTPCFALLQVLFRSPNLTGCSGCVCSCFCFRRRTSSAPDCQQECLPRPRARSQPMPPASAAEAASLAPPNDELVLCKGTYVLRAWFQLMPARQVCVARLERRLVSLFDELESNHELLCRVVDCVQLSKPADKPWWHVVQPAGEPKTAVASPCTGKLAHSRKRCHESGVKGRLQGPLLCEGRVLEQHHITRP